MGYDLKKIKREDKFYARLSNGQIIKLKALNADDALKEAEARFESYRAIMNASPSIPSRVLSFTRIPIEHKYITIEPIMDFDLYEFIKLIKACNPRQVNIGADSNPNRNKLPEPPKEKILELIAELETFTKVVQKKNLKRLLK